MKLIEKYPQSHDPAVLRATLDTYVPGWREMDREALLHLVNDDLPAEHETGAPSLAYAAGFYARSRGIIGSDIEDASAL